jgi:MFS superfamily sulfate permease-like transporter
MEDLTTHPLIVVVFAAVVGLVVAAMKAVAMLFQRVTRVETTLESVDEKVDRLSVDLRAHMNEESQNIGRLEALIQGISKRRQD